jgi:hypothetical protein
MFCSKFRELCEYSLRVEGLTVINKLINYHVPSNATEKMYNIQFILLNSHVLTILSGHHQVNTKLNKCSIELQAVFTFHIGSYLQWFMLDDSINMGKNLDIKE